MSFLSFAVVLLVAELATRLLAPSLPVDPGKWPRIEIAQKLDQMRGYANDAQDTEVVFVGSSMMAGGVDPVAFTKRSGLPAYNAAFAGPSMRTVAPWTVDIVEPLLDPEVVVVGIQTRELNDNGEKNRVMSHDFLTSPGYREATSTISGAVVGGLERLSYLLRYRRAFREPSILFEPDGREALAAARVRHQIGARGRRNDRPGSYHVSADFIQDLYERTLKDFKVGGPEYQALLDLHRNLTDEGIEMIVLNMPVSDDYWTAHSDPDGEREVYRNLLDDFVDKTGATLIDAENAFGNQDSFRDPMHLDVESRVLFGEGLAADWKLVDQGGRFDLRCSVTCELRRSGTIAAGVTDAWVQASRAG